MSDEGRQTLEINFIMGLSFTVTNTMEWIFKVYFWPKYLLIHSSLNSHDVPEYNSEQNRPGLHVGSVLL